MAYWSKAPIDREQISLFARTLDSWIPPDHPVRIFDEVLSALDWSSWEARYCGCNGQPPIHPRIMAGAILYGLSLGMSRILARRGPLEQDKHCLCMGSESGGSDIADPAAMGRRTVGVADQHAAAPEKAGNIDRTGRGNDPAGLPIVATTGHSRGRRRFFMPLWQVSHCPTWRPYPGSDETPISTVCRPREEPNAGAGHIQKWTTITFSQRGIMVQRLLYTRVVLWPSVSRRPIRLVISRDPQGKQKDDFFFTTDIDMSAAEVLSCYSDRWAIEDTFRQTKQSLGAQQPQTCKGQGPERAAAGS